MSREHRQFQALLEAQDGPTRAARAVHRVVEEALTPRQRQIVELRYREGLSQQEITQRLGVNKSTVSRTLHRAHERIRRSFCGIL